MLDDCRSIEQRFLFFEAKAGSRPLMADGRAERVKQGREPVRGSRRGLCERAERAARSDVDARGVGRDLPRAI